MLHSKELYIHTRSMNMIIAIVVVVICVVNGAV